MVRFRDKKNESDDTDGVFAAVPEDIIAHRILARLDAISMFRFALSSKTNFERVFGDNKDGTTNPNNSIITKTSSSSSSSTMMMVRNKTSHVERETRRRTTNTTPVCCWAIAR